MVVAADIDKDCKSSILDHYGLFTKCESWVKHVLVL